MDAWDRPVRRGAVRPSGGEPAWWALPLLAPFGLVAASAVQEFVRRGQRDTASVRSARAASDVGRVRVREQPDAAVDDDRPARARRDHAQPATRSSRRCWRPPTAADSPRGTRASRRRSGSASDGRRTGRTCVHGSRGCVRTSRTSRSCTSPARAISARASAAGSLGGPVGLRIEAAETLADPPRRMMYVPSDGGPADHGVAAFGRCLEHINIVWAVFGFALRLPVCVR